MYRIQYTEYSINVDTLIFLLHEIATNKRCPQLFLLDLPRMRCNRYWHYCVVCTYMLPNTKQHMPLFHGFNTCY